MVEQEGHGVREDFAKQPARQMPEVFCPHPLYGVTSGQLRKDGIYPVAKTAQQSTPFGVGISFLGGVGSQELNRHARQLFLGFGRVVVAVPDDDPGGELDEFGEQVEFMSVGWSYAQASDYAWPGYPHVYSKAVEGLPEQRIFAEGSLTTEAFTAVGTSEEARWQGHRVADGQSGVVGGEAEKLLPEALLDLPKVGCLPGKGGAMHFCEGGKPLAVMTPEVPKDPLVGVYPQELAYDLDGEDFCVRKFGQGATRSEGSVFDAVVDEAEDRDDEGVKIHRKRPPSLRLVWAPPSVGRSPLLFNRSEKLAHGVSYRVTRL